MRSSAALLVRDVMSLQEQCDECSGATQFEQIAWLRPGGERGLPIPNIAQTKSGSIAPLPRDTELADDIGAFALARIDGIGVVFDGNHANSQAIVAAEAREKRWRTVPLLSNDKCAGWAAISYASNGVNVRYFVSRGKSSQSSADKEAKASANTFADKQPMVWSKKVIVSFNNFYKAPPVDFSKDVIEGGKVYIRQVVVDECASLQSDSVAIGLRG